MGKKKIRIIRKDSNKEDYTFVISDNILNNKFSKDCRKDSRSLACTDQKCWSCSNGSISGRDR
jgi:hypothetical protein